MWKPARSKGAKPDSVEPGYCIDQNVFVGVLIRPMSFAQILKTGEL